MNLGALVYRPLDWGHLLNDPRRAGGLMTINYFSFHDNTYKNLHLKHHHSMPVDQNNSSIWM